MPDVNRWQERQEPSAVAGNVTREAFFTSNDANADPSIPSRRSTFELNFFKARASQLVTGCLRRWKMGYFCRYGSSWAGRTVHLLHVVICVVAFFSLGFHHGGNVRILTDLGGGTCFGH